MHARLRLKPFMADCTLGDITPRLSRHQFIRHSATDANTPLGDPGNAKPLSEMPGPKGLPYFGNVFLYLKNLGRSFELFSENCRKYGPVHLFTAPNNATVIVGDPDAAREFYHRSEKFPARAPTVPWTHWKETHGKIPGVLLRWGDPRNNIMNMSDRKHYLHVLLAVMATAWEGGGNRAQAVALYIWGAPFLGCAFKLFFTQIHTRINILLHSKRFWSATLKSYSKLNTITLS